MRKNIHRIFPVIITLMLSGITAGSSAVPAVSEAGARPEAAAGEAGEKTKKNWR